MNVQEFREAYTTYEAKIWKTRMAQDEYTRLRETMETSAAPEHVIDWAPSGGFIDQIICSCGWKGPGHWDGADYELIAWREHIAGAMGLIEQKCVCGKKYLPADGGEACHKVVEV